MGPRVHVTDKRILQGWKEIAEYVDRDERTVKRWEKQRDFPVRRMPGNGRTNVYIDVSDLEVWLSHSEISQEAPPAEPVELPVQALAVEPKKPVLPWAPAVLTILLLCAGVAALALHSHSPPAHPAAIVSASYHSKAPGVDELYVRGVYLYEQRRPDSLRAAEHTLQQAIDRDSNDAPAWAALAVTHNLLREYGSMPSAEAYAKGRFEAQAISLDPMQSDPHAALGYIEFFWDWNAPAAAQEFRRAIDLNPNSVLGHHWYGSMLNHEGRFTEALEQLDIAQRLEPNSPAILSTRAIAEGFGGHREQALEILEEVAEQDPNFSEAPLTFGILNLLPPADIPHFLSGYRRWADLTHGDAALKSETTMGRAYKLHGRAAMWQALLDQEERRSPDTPTMSDARAQAALGHSDAAFAELDQLVKRHDVGLIGVNLTPEFLPLHGDPRYARLLAEIGLPPLR